MYYRNYIWKFAFYPFTWKSYRKSQNILVVLFCFQIWWRKENKIRLQLLILAIFIFSWRNLCILKMTLKHMTFNERNIMVDYCTQNSSPVNVVFLTLSTSCQFGRRRLPWHLHDCWHICDNSTIQNNLGIAYSVSQDLNLYATFLKIFKIILLISKKYFWSQYRLCISVRF